MQGHIDQIDSTVHFESRQVLQTWDDQIQSLCFQVNSIIDKIQVVEPEWLAKTLDNQMAWKYITQYKYFKNLNFHAHFKSRQVQLPTFAYKPQ